MKEVIFKAILSNKDVWYKNQENKVFYSNNNFYYEGASGEVKIIEPCFYHLIVID